MLILGLQKTTLLDYPGHIASTIFTGGCNFRCPYCHNADLVINPGGCAAYDNDEIFAHFQKRAGILDGVCITGGEPTLQQDLYEFAARIKNLGLLIKLDTNGTHPEIVEKLINDGIIDYVAMDIKHTKERYSEVACMNNFDISTIKRSVELLINSPIDYEFRTTVCAGLHEASDFEAIGQWLKGAKNYYLQAYRLNDNVINPIYESPDFKTLQSYQGILEKYIEHIGIRGIDQ